MPILQSIQPLPQNTKLVDEDGYPSLAFTRWWQQLFQNADTTQGDVSDLDANKVPTSRLITATTPITIDGGASADLSADRTLAHADSGVTPGSYTNANVTFDAKGHATAAANGSGGSSNERTRVVPLATNFTLDNAGTASMADTTYGLALTIPTVASQIRHIRSNTAPPATPYSMIVRAQPVSPYSGGGLYGMSLIARNSSNGRIIIYGDYNNTQHLVQRWSAYATFSANSLAATTAQFALHMPWMKMENDGTDLKFSRSPDGNEWHQFHTEALATYITAAGGSLDQIGFGTMMNNLGSTAKMMFQSYEVV